MIFSRLNFIKILEIIQPYVIDFHTPGDGIILRHDVDGDFEKTMEAAKIEYEMGIKATIFILNTWPPDKPYFQPNDLLFRVRLRAMQNYLGHEIGWHNDCLSEHYEKGTPIKEAIERPLRELREMGLTIRCTSSHGGAWQVKKRVANYNVFGFHCWKLPDYVGPTWKLERFGLEVEAMQDKRDDHLSDGGMKWNKDPFETLDKWINNKGRYQLLMHPQSYDL